MKSLVRVSRTARCTDPVVRSGARAIGHTAILAVLSAFGSALPAVEWFQDADYITGKHLYFTFSNEYMGHSVLNASGGRDSYDEMGKFTGRGELDFYGGMSYFDAEGVYTESTFPDCNGNLDVFDSAGRHRGIYAPNYSGGYDLYDAYGNAFGEVNWIYVSVYNEFNKDPETIESEKFEADKQAETIEGK